MTLLSPGPYVWLDGLRLTGGRPTAHEAVDVHGPHEWSSLLFYCRNRPHPNIAERDPPTMDSTGARG